MMKYTLLIITLLILILGVPSVYAADTIPIYLRPKIGGILQPEIEFNYEFNFTTDIACTNVLLSDARNITTDRYGIGFAEINISSMTGNPLYLCEYRNGSLRKTHTISSALASKIRASDTLNVTENATFQKDVIINGILYGGSPVRIDGVNISNNIFSLSDDLNGSLRFTLKNINSGSNATTIITAENDVGSSMNIGVGSSTFMIGSTLYANITALFSRAMGKTIFANLYNQMFVWMYNPSDDNDPNNLVELMRLDGNGLNVSTNITAENVFLPQYIFAHTNENDTLTGAGAWTNLTFAEEATDIKEGITHTHNDATNDTFTINADGIYYISYNFDVIDTSTSSTDIDVAGRVVFVNGTEIAGSVFETDITKKQIETELSHETLAKLNSGDKILFQFTATDADVIISTHGTYGDHPESSSIIIEKRYNLP